jgi:hypothetical protein
MIHNIMVKILKKKAKASSTQELVDSIYQPEADAQGITLKEFYKRRAIRIAQQAEYKKTHWVSKLTDAQKYLIATTTPLPHSYMGLPLSVSNQKELEHFKENSKGYSEWLRKIDKYNKSQMMSKVLREANPRFDVGGVDDLMEEVMWQKVRTNYKELAEEHGQPFIEIFNAYKKTKGKTSSDKLANYLRTRRKENKQQTTIRMAMEQLRNSLEPLRNATQTVQDAIAKDYQELGRKLRVMPDIVEDPNIEVKHNRYKYDPKFESSEKKRLVEVSHGLNTLMSKNKLKKPLDIADHYLKTYNEPSKADYFVDSFDNAVALANATGMLPQRMFKLICDDLVKRRSHYEDQAFMADGIKVEELINLYEAKKAKKKGLSFSMFFSSKERKQWSVKYNKDWKNYKRFMEVFPKWLKIFKAEAHKRAESDADMVADFLAKG